MNRLPSHIGVIPDGNRRWAVTRGPPKEDGYQAGLATSRGLFKICHGFGIKELTFYGFTQDNTKRPKEQTKAFQKACVGAVHLLSKENAELLVMGSPSSPLFPRELRPYTKRTTFGSGGMKVNPLLNYGWLWDLSRAMNDSEGNGFTERIYSSNTSKVGSDHPLGRKKAAKWILASTVGVLRFLHHRRPLAKF